MGQTYSYEHSFNASLAYFNGDELATKVFLDKYALKTSEGLLLEDNPAMMHRRIAREFARIEGKKFKNPLTEDAIYSLLDQFRYIVPQGSPMFGIGNTHQTISLSNCFLLDVPLDSYSSIMQIDEQLVNISKRRGGVGIDLSNLRPAGSITHNAAKTSTGIVTWMERYSNSIREVGQEGRRGALMLTLSIHHPDILAFCTIKNDPTKVTGANISVRLTRAFLDAVKNNEEYEVCFPVDYRERGVPPVISKRISAKEVWETIIHSAWLRAEPGLLMWDNVTEQTPADRYERFKSRGTNPCQPAWAPILTEKGLSTIGDLKEGDRIWSETGWTTVVRKWSTGIKEVYRYQTTAGVFFGTENHRIVSHGEKVEAQFAETIDRLSGSYIRQLTVDPQDVMDGIVFGDGSVHRASNNLVHLCIGKDDEDYHQSEVENLICKHRPGLSNYAWEITTTIKAEELPLTFNRSVPDRFVYTAPNKVAGFLRGLYTANGSVVADRITLKASSFKVVEQVQLMLSSLGIASYYTTNKPTRVQFSNGEYLCKESYDLNITRDREVFASLIGFIQLYKVEKMNRLIKECRKSNKVAKVAYDITSVTKVSEEEVFDITVDNACHTYWTGGLNVSNCSEINLSPLDSCRLLLQNLLSYVLNPFTSDARFDFTLFRQHAKLAQRLMDDLVDLESEKIDAIITKVKSDPEPDEVKAREIALWTKVKANNDEGRRTGTGITALGDALAALGIPYGSDHAITFTEEVYRTLKLGCYESSVDMAEELGAFLGYDAKLEKDCPFIQRIAEEDPALYARMVKSGRRNVSLITTAPAGSVSLLTRTTSGIEPLFMTGYTRRKKINSNDKNAKIDFVDALGDSWQEFMVYHPQVKTWMNITGQKDVTKSPWHGNCAEDINWINRVKLQAAAGRHVCHSISSTINLPESVTEEQVGLIYRTAFESGLKGITVYRKNCRSGVMVETTKPAVESKERGHIIVKTKAPKRPEKLPGELHHFTIKGHRYFVAVGLLSGEPYEIFAGSNHDSEGDTLIPRTIVAGSIVKHSRGKYSLFTGEKNYSVVVPNSDANIDSLTRMISTALRHGADISFVVHQLEKTRGEMQSFAKILARALKKYIKDGTVVAGEKCASCGGSNIVRENGCKICKDCGSASCG